MLASTTEFADLRLRREDYSLSDEQQLLRESYARLLAIHSPPERVRQVEQRADRFDHELWSRMVGMGASTLGVPVDAGGDGGGLVDMALVAEQIGRAGAATPFIEAAALGRVLGSLQDGPTRRELAQQLCAGLPVLTLALADDRRRQLLPCGAVADGAVALVGQDLVLVRGARRSAPANIASAPIAWWELDPRAATTLLSGERAVAQFRAMVRAWKLLTAAALIGIAQSALDAAVRYAKERNAFGVPIGAFQAVSHPLADVATDIGAARRLVWKAAWFEDHEPQSAPELAPMATVAANKIAARAVAVGVHTQGGFGVTLDSNMQLFFRRAKGWPSLAGRAEHDLWQVAELIRGGLPSSAQGRPA